MTPHFRAFLLGLVVLALSLFICMTSHAMTIGVDPPADPKLRYELHCLKIQSTKLEVISDKVFAGLPTWKSVKGSAREEPCPATNGRWVEIPTEQHRNYHLYMLLVTKNEAGETIAARELPPYFWFQNERPSKLRPPVILSI